MNIKKGEEGRENANKEQAAEGCTALPFSLLRDSWSRQLLSAQTMKQFTQRSHNHAPNVWGVMAEYVQARDRLINHHHGGGDEDDGNEDGLLPKRSF